MMARRTPGAAVMRWAAGIGLVLALGGSERASAAPTLGFLEDWTGTSVDGWGGGSTSYTNPGSGGVGGAADGYLRVTQSADGNFGTRSVGSEYAGDWLAAGIERLRDYLN